MGLKWHNKNIDKTINISDEAKVDTDWWLNNIDTACHNIIIPRLDLIIRTDACLTVWNITHGVNPSRGFWIHKK